MGWSARAAQRGTCLAGLVLLGACAARPPAAPAVDAGPPAGIDGRYRGTARLLRGDRACPRSGPRVYDVVGGAVTMSYSGNRLSARSTPQRVPLTATVRSDGIVQASDGVGTLDGQLQNGTLEFTISSAVCEHRWTLRQVN